jgi:hypothetical protein
MPSLPEVIVWTGASRAALARAVLAELAGAVQPIAVGGPRHAAISDLAKALTCPCDDDARRLVVDHPAAYLFLAGGIDISSAALTAAAAQGAIILHVEPISDSLHCLRPLAPLLDDKQARVIALPDLLRSTGWIRAAEPLQAVGNVRSLAYLRSAVDSTAPLAAGLEEAARLTIEFAGMPITIDAHSSAAGELNPKSEAAAPAHLTAHARLPDGRGAVWMISQVSSSAAASFDRSLHLIGDEGRLQLCDESYELSSHAAGMLDRLEPPAPAQRPGFATLIARQWRQLIDRPALLPPPAAGPGLAKRLAAILACRQAALLSARSGQPENPGQLLATHGW